MCSTGNFRSPCHGDSRYPLANSYRLLWRGWLHNYVGSHTPYKTGSVQFRLTNTEIVTQRTRQPIVCWKDLWLHIATILSTVLDHVPVLQHIVKRITVRVGGKSRLGHGYATDSSSQWKRECNRIDRHVGMDRSDPNGHTKPQSGKVWCNDNSAQSLNIVLVAYEGCDCLHLWGYELCSKTRAQTAWENADIPTEWQANKTTKGCLDNIIGYHVSYHCIVQGYLRRHRFVVGCHESPQIATNPTVIPMVSPVRVMEVCWQRAVTSHGPGKMNHMERLIHE